MTPQQFIHKLFEDIIPYGPECPISERQAVEWINAVLSKLGSGWEEDQELQTSGALDDVSKEDLMKAWNGIAFLYPSLSPQNLEYEDQELERETKDGEFAYKGLRFGVEDELEDTDEDPETMDRMRKLGARPEMFSKSSKRTGYPHGLMPIVNAVTQLYKDGDITEEEYYPSESLHAGMTFRMPDNGKVRGMEI